MLNSALVGEERWCQAPKLQSALETCREASKLFGAAFWCAQNLFILLDNMLLKEKICPSFMEYLGLVQLTGAPSEPPSPTALEDARPGGYNYLSCWSSATSRQQKRQRCPCHSCPRNCLILTEPLVHLLKNKNQGLMFKTQCLPLPMPRIESFHSGHTFLPLPPRRIISYSEDKRK